MTSTAEPAPGARAEQRGLEDDLGWALGTVFRAYLKLARAALADLPWGPRGYQVLAAADRDDPCAQHTLGERVGVDRSVMTNLVDDLVEAGLVERKPDPNDRRARQVVLTDVGRERLAELDQRIEGVEQQVLGALPEDSRRPFREALFHLARRADELDPAGPTCAVVADVARLTEA